MLIYSFVPLCLRAAALCGGCAASSSSGCGMATVCAHSAGPLRPGELPPELKGGSNAGCCLLCAHLSVVRRCMWGHMFLAGVLPLLLSLHSRIRRLGLARRPCCRGLSGRQLRRAHRGASLEGRQLQLDLRIAAPRSNAVKLTDTPHVKRQVTRSHALARQSTAVHVLADLQKSCVKLCWSCRACLRAVLRHHARRAAVPAVRIGAIAPVLRRPGAAHAELPVPAERTASHTLLTWPVTMPFRRLQVSHQLLMTTLTQPPQKGRLLPRHRHRVEQST